MTLNELIEEVDVVATEGDLGVRTTGLCYDSRRARRGDAFFALPGLRADGGAFARAAVESGAVAVIGARGAVAAGSPAAARVEVEDPRLALAQAANRFFAHPSRELSVVGVTGTNGKTTITWMLESIFRAAGIPAGVVGTTGARFAGVKRTLPFTTPESPELQGLLREMVEAEVRAVALEVSSHALAQRRSFGLECDVAVFTNLSHDHLDYHGTMDSYLDAKLRLFDGRNGATSKPVRAVINLDDGAAARVIEAARRGGREVLTYGRHPEARTRVERVRPSSDGIELALRCAAGETFELRLPMLGSYNAWNAAAAWTAAEALGLRPAELRRGLEAATGAPGRLERVRAGQPFEVVVDYAHTPDALASALAAVHEHAAGRVLLVFGCGGDRDRAKRPAMGALAARHAEVAWVTSDNPRSEDPGSIAREILAGAPGGGLRLELDRRAAIAAAIAEAQPGDTVLIAGKGHETTQTIGDRVVPFDDRDVARKLIDPAGRGA